MSRSRRPRTGLWIVTFSNGGSTRIVAKNADQALNRAKRWLHSQAPDVTIIGIHEVI